ncbi:MAG: hypothetical protein H0X44_04960 [Acidobacteria bacterium]|nr:hypothetical protein [Acidobacteriota bacterium]
MHATLFRAALAAVVLSTGVSAGASAQTATADALIQRNLAARGGVDRMKAITTMRHTRTVGTPFSNVKVVLIRQRPNLLRVEQTPSGRPTTARIVTPDGSWDETPQGWKARSATNLAEGLDVEADFDGLLVDYQAKGHRAEYVGLDKIGGKPAHHLKLTLKSGAERHVYLDPVTFLERRHTGSLRTPTDAAVPFIMDFSDWREVNGVLFPFAMDEDREAMGQTYAIYVESIEVNVPVDAAGFAAPLVK